MNNKKGVGNNPFLKERYKMIQTKVNFNEKLGLVKPMHATNNGPAVRQERLKNNTLTKWNSNLDEFKAAGIPYARNHDASFYHRYGQEHTVDVHYVFPNFDADPENPDSYDFACTDHYLLGCEAADTEVFYRLGSRIEHEVKKYGIHPPKDFHKWAVICEHIIRHYTEGWANGFHMKITYWEIWNEPDLHWNDGLVSPTWSGTQKQFFELYNITAKHLKKCFPHLKIGGPAIASDLGWAEDFLKQLDAPLDFFSWHSYGQEVRKYTDKVKCVRALLDKYGYTETESILNEWNYVRGWDDNNIVYSHEQRRKIKGAAFSLAVMSACQYEDVDMLMYYDARPNEFWNGLFDDMVIGRVLKGYYPFPMFNELYKLGECVSAKADGDDGYICAAKNDTNGAVVFSRFNNDDSTPDDKVSFDLDGFDGAKGTEVEVYVLDADRNLEQITKLVYYGSRFAIELPAPNFTCYLLRLIKL